MELDFQPGDKLVLAEPLERFAQHRARIERHGASVLRPQIAQHPAGVRRPRQDAEARHVGNHQDVRRALQLGHADAAAGRERREDGLVRSVFQQQRARHCHAALQRRLYFARRERLAAQDAVLVGERKAHALQLVRFDFLEDVHTAQPA